MPKLPPHVIRALREAQNISEPVPEQSISEPVPEQLAERLARLTHSIEGAAAPLLAARSRVEPGWWELPAEWAATLIPASLVLALASILVLWRVQPPRPERQVAEAPVDQAVNELVTTPPR
jgi:hypothetical protein